MAFLPNSSGSGGLAKILLAIVKIPIKINKTVGKTLLILVLYWGNIFFSFFLSFLFIFKNRWYVFNTIDFNIFLGSQKIIFKIKIIILNKNIAIVLIAFKMYIIESNKYLMILAEIDLKLMFK